MVPHREGRHAAKSSGVAASGTVQARRLVQVGTQVSGVIEKLFVDFNSKVTAGQTIALSIRADGRPDRAGRCSASRARRRTWKPLRSASSSRLGPTSSARRRSTLVPGRVESRPRVLTQAGARFERQKTSSDRKLTRPPTTRGARDEGLVHGAQLAWPKLPSVRTRPRSPSPRRRSQQNEAQVAVGEASDQAGGGAQLRATA
jgi:pyruvate/2-oxoglutarate dehydrogenase complex dihydrolipoamide acyltransferase (E2) component